MSKPIKLTGKAKPASRTGFTPEDEKTLLDARLDQADPTLALPPTQVSHGKTHMRIPAASQSQSPATIAKPLSHAQLKHARRSAQDKAQRAVEEEADVATAAAAKAVPDATPVAARNSKEVRRTAERAMIERAAAEQVAADEELFDVLDRAELQDKQYMQKVGKGKKHALHFPPISERGPAFDEDDPCHDPALMALKAHTARVLQEREVRYGGAGGSADKEPQWPGQAAFMQQLQSSMAAQSDTFTEAIGTLQVNLSKSLATSSRALEARMTALIATSAEASQKANNHTNTQVNALMSSTQKTAAGLETLKGGVKALDGRTINLLHPLLAVNAAGQQVPLWRQRRRMSMRGCKA